MFRKLGNYSMRYSHKGFSKWHCFLQRPPMTSHSHWRRCRRMSGVVKEVIAESQVGLSEISYVPPFCTPHQRFWHHSHHFIPIFEDLWIVSHYCNWEWLPLSGVLEEEIKWLWTLVLQVKYKILCLLFVCYCLPQLQYFPNFNLLLLPSLITAIANLVCSLI